MEKQGSQLGCKYFLSLSLPWLGEQAGEVVMMSEGESGPTQY